MAARDNSAALYAYDARYGCVLCGVDEAGRGPLCGPVCAAAVILNPGAPIAGIDDSKKIPGKRREMLYGEITEKAAAYKIVMVPPAEIDRLNILGATMLAMSQAVAGLGAAPQLVLVDGNRAPDVPYPCRAVVKGDSLSASIAAASVLAKVARDRYMRELDRAFPQYRLAGHKGYPTRLHYEMLALYGPQDFYRKSFLKNMAEKL